MAHLFNGATNVTVNGGSFVANAGSSPKGTLNALDAVVAPNAILNAGGRADEVRCFPGTREEVIERLERFMDDESPGRKRMMWLNGPAGAGKSAICQTVAERRSEQGRHAANFFFFRGDSTRGHAKPLVATLVYQLRSLYPALDEPLSNYLAKDSLICNASIEKQFKHLISSTIPIIRQSTPIQQQIVIIIDGLDECNNDEREQDQILVALHTLAHAEDSPFLVLVSSRAEPHLVMSFNRLGSSVKSIFLNEDYQPEKDIRLFVAAKFAEIKKDHHLAGRLSKDWPTNAEIDAITKKSSGHFIYAATVMRYIQFSSANPARSLATILEMPPSTNHNPLAHLDAVYSHIFSKVNNIHAVKLILLARNCGAMSGRPTDYSYRILYLVGFNDTEVESYFADLTALIQFNPEGKLDLLRFYHASLQDYLDDKSRSTIYYPYENEIAAKLSSMCLRKIHDADSIQYTIQPLHWVKQPTPELSKSFLAASTRFLDSKKPVLFLGELITHIRRLYWEDDKAQFRTLLQSWSRFVHINNLDKTSHGLQSTLRRYPSFSEYHKQYWLTEDDNSQEPLSPSAAESDGAAKSNTQVIPERVSLNTVISHPPCMSESLENEQKLNRTPAKTVKGHQKASHPNRSYAFASLFRELFDSIRCKFKVMRRQPRVTSHTVGNNEGESPPKFSMIRVKIQYQGDIRSMTLSPNTPFSEFLNKVTAKFGKNFDELTMKFADEDGDDITARDDSDYEHAIATACKSSTGKADCVLKIWCEDRA